jgi:YggT family protein
MSNPILWLVHTLIWLYIYILIGMAILSWLMAFQMVNTRNRFVAMAAEFFYRVTEPLCAQFGICCPILVASTFRQ